MSGPKTSSYTLTAEQRRLLRELAKLQRKIEVDKERIKENSKQVSGIVSEIDTAISKISKLSSGNELYKDLLQMRNEAMEVVNYSKELQNSNDIISLNAQNTKLKRVLNNLLGSKDGYNKKIALLRQASNEKFAEIVSNNGIISFKNFVRKVDNKELEELNNLANNIKNTLSGVNQSHLPLDYKAELNDLLIQLSEMDSIEFMKNFYAMSVKPMLKKCADYENFYQEYYEEYETLVAQYSVVAKEAGVEPERIAFSIGALNILQQKIEELEDTISYLKEQEYISKCVEDAMQEMGYNVIGNREVVKKSGRKFRNELYLFDEGTAINVTYTDNGQISMELGGLDNRDRIPTNAESIALADTMYSFCDSYAELEKRLLKKGIVTKHISILPPEEQYAQIINVEDYEMCEKVSEYNVNTTKKSLHSNSALHKEL